MKKAIKLLLISGLLVIGMPALAQETRALLRGPQLVKELRRQVTRQGQRTRESAIAWRNLQEVSKIIPTARSVFLARPDLGGEVFSGGVFEVSYDGKKEIFGFVAAHTLAEEPHSWIERVEGSWNLKRTFNVEIAGERIPAEVVQLSSPRMLDVVLVKFRPEDEKLFKPFVLAPRAPVNGQLLQFSGFGDYGAVSLTRRVLAQTPLSLRTDMHYPRNGRPGFCGGGLFDMEGKLVGVHTGSNREIDQFDDIGYATHAKFLRTLADAYHNDGKATFSLELDGKKMIDLAVDEYVCQMDFFDKNKENVGMLTVEHKFSYSALKKKIETRNPRYIRFNIGQIRWVPKDPQFVQEKSYLRQVVYDLKKQRVVSKTLE